MKSLITTLVVLLSLNSYAGKCVLDVTREACAGKEKESFAKCPNGTKQCTEDKEATSEKDCAKKALKACDNARTDVTKSKIITASFDGKPVDGGKNFCTTDRPDFNKCK